MLYAWLYEVKCKPKKNGACDTAYTRQQSAPLCMVQLWSSVG